MLYVVLSDPKKRIVYDTYGEEGLNASWDIGPRYKSQDEVHIKIVTVQQHIDILSIVERRVRKARARKTRIGFRTTCAKQERNSIDLKCNTRI